MAPEGQAAYTARRALSGHAEAKSEDEDADKENGSAPGRKRRGPAALPAPIFWP